MGADFCTGASVIAVNDGGRVCLTDGSHRAVAMHRCGLEARRPDLRGKKGEIIASDCPELLDITRKQIWAVQTKKPSGNWAFLLKLVAGAGFEPAAFRL